jgi:GNAT superfamily N-acetyltransferase
VARAVVGVREARAEDMPALTELWSQLREQGLRGSRPAVEQAEVVEARFRAAMADPAYRLVVAHIEAEIVGMALFALAPANPLRDQGGVVEVTHVCVSDRHRRQGAGNALMAAALDYADERACESVVVAVLPQHRDAHRFYARLGFVPVAVRRIAPVAVLRRRLAPRESRAAALRRSPLIRRIR